MSARDRALVRLRALDDELEQSLGPLRSLAPQRARARRLHEIGGSLWPDHAHEGVIERFTDGVIVFVRALHESFPENLLWDLDYPLAAWWTSAQQDACLSLAAELQRLFGRGSPLRFRYAHDFVYGFDWAKWVAREPSVRRAIGPFDLPFLQAMAARGHELVARIERGGDDTYPRLPEGRARNPFRFSREPAAELALHRALAQAGAIPVPAWEPGAALEWNRPYAELRRARAIELGLSVAPPP